MYKVAVIGDKKSILCFKALGISVYPASDKNEVRDTIEKLAKDNYAVIFITEDLSKLVKETIDRYKKQLLPAIILIPSNKGSEKIGLEEINRNVEKAIGANILN